MNFDQVPAFRFNVSVSDDELAENPNLYFEGADLVFMMISSALVLLMIPGLSFFYSGVSQRLSGMSMMWLPMMTAALVQFQWFLWGYSLVFSSSSNNFWGDSKSLTLHNVLANPVVEKPGPRIPDLVFAMYQGMFACFTASVVSGAVYKKYNSVHFLVFIFIWTTLVYDPIARWSWNSQGWTNRLGSLDFAGGTVVHIVSATTTAVYAKFINFRAWLRRQVLPDLNREDIPSNVSHVVLGTVFLWIGWFGFNGGSALGANLRAVSACISTTLAASTGGLTMCVLDRLYMLCGPDPNGPRPQTRFSVISFCNGAVAGLVAITPAAGFIPFRLSPVFGVLGAFSCGWCLRFSSFVNDPLSIVVVHGVGGFVGMILTGILASAETAHLDGYTEISGGWLNHNWQQLGIQLADAISAIAYTAFGSLGILVVMESVLSLRLLWNGAQEVTTFQIVTDENEILLVELGQIEAQPQP